ncbi:cation diffusion facilitator family transporter [Mobilisporobacter senegalensis]|uniref:Cation diffusion facilitator family transporter n=1 Tax=Mobilisporobacter senegalensis TaxID=1329262 RepID=A0A3N1XQW3_9FIRM|nr:cation diffusion facilitator family transporter [Mobilisporobacter senegalensis]ROR28668.1 cation diffusion facilitator family transporter [Mobilisporobacter senegalensis]
MTEFLVKLFVKDREKIEQSKVRTSYGILSSVVGVVCNIILFAVKISIGLAIHSISVMADAFNNLSDASSGIISFIGVKLANRPADKEHPFGHGRFEYLSAFVVAFLVLQVGFTCFKNAISKIIHPESMEFNIILVGILCISVLLKLWLGLFNRKLGNRINSSVMKATSADAFGDVLITVVTIVAIVVEKLTGFKVDGYMGLVVSLFVLYAGYNIAKETIEPLIGEAVNPELYEKITTMVENYDGIVGSHDLIVHNYGPTHTMASIHAEVPNDIDFEVAHETIDRIERDAQKELGIFLVIHMDPIEVNDTKVLSIKNMVIDTVKEYDEGATIHDFRMVNGEEQINLIFDLVVAHSYSEDKEYKLIQDVMEAVAEKDKRYQCIITLEHSFIRNR